MYTVNGFVSFQIHADQVVSITTLLLKLFITKYIERNLIHLLEYPAFEFV